MTQAQRKQLDRAEEIMTRDGLAVVGSGWTRTGQRVYAVPSRTERGRWHLVVVAGARLVCDCEAARRGRICAHRAAVRARIAEERARDEANMHGAMIDFNRGWN